MKGLIEEIMCLKEALDDAEATEARLEKELEEKRERIEELEEELEKANEYMALHDARFESFN